jgi:hypothetical protein
MPTNNRSGVEVRPGKPAVTLRIMEVRQWQVCRCLVHPLGDRLENLGTDGLGSDGDGEELPIGFGIEMAGIER